MTPFNAAVSGRCIRGWNAHIKVLAQTPTEERLSNIDVNARAQPEEQVTQWITLALTYLLTAMD